jgi:hypothetical protein
LHVATSAPLPTLRSRRGRCWACRQKASHPCPRARTSEAGVEGSGKRPRSCETLFCPTGESHPAKKWCSAHMVHFTPPYHTKTTHSLHCPPSALYHRSLRKGFCNLPPRFWSPIPIVGDLLFSRRRSVQGFSISSQISPFHGVRDSQYWNSA